MSRFLTDRIGASVDGAGFAARADALPHITAFRGLPTHVGADVLKIGGLIVLHSHQVIADFGEVETETRTII